MSKQSEYAKAVEDLLAAHPETKVGDAIAHVAVEHGVQPATISSALYRSRRGQGRGRAPAHRRWTEQEQVPQDLDAILADLDRVTDALRRWAREREAVLQRLRSLA